MKTRSLKYLTFYFLFVSFLFANNADVNKNPDDAANKILETTQQPENVTPPKSEIDQCIDSLNAMDKTVVLDALKNCALKNKDNEKIQNALLSVLENRGDDYEITKISFLLLSNQNNDNILGKLVEILKSDKYSKDASIQYVGTVVLHSIQGKNKEAKKEVYQNFSQSSDDLLKNLSENLLKQP